MNLLLLMILLPLISFLCICFSNRKFPNFVYNFLGVFPIFICFILINYFYIHYFHDENQKFHQFFWTWMELNNIPINFSLYIDKLSIIMLEVITGVGFLIQFFSIWYMRKKNDIGRFFSYTNLFFSSMILLVLSDNLLVTYFSWELVGFCSYALIGFYYTISSNIKSSMKAFIVTRIGDLFILLAIFLLFVLFHTLNFSHLLKLSYHKNIYHDCIYLKLSMIFILLGALSKSAQFPLQVWLLKAMVGPTPVSALIHSATMITAGVYLILRISFLFEIFEEILFIVSILGVLTILIASISAIYENNIKKILAYSTMSQIGYMFLGLGMKLWGAVISYLVIHSFFKALLFLSAGVLISSCNNESNIFKISVSKRTFPFLYSCFLIGVLSLIACPFLTSSFYTKSLIISGIFNKNYYIFFFLAVFGSFLTAIYSSRMLFLIFFKSKKLKIKSFNNVYYFLPLLILSILSSFIGILSFHPLLQRLSFSEFLDLKKIFVELCVFSASLCGVIFSYYLYVLNFDVMKKQYKKMKKSRILKFFDKNFGLDYLYEFCFIKTFLFLKRIFFVDNIKKILDNCYCLLKLLNNNLIIFENKSLSFYILAIFTGTLIILCYFLLFLQLI
ncbi:NADH-quinone oxidoreductase subunit L [Buchnera aphidicola]|uniref:NADH-quinone oxidoreductase subunit L n=1 Tax=Buchnera aphidicola TaxID=9 RepID=UPI00209369EA|nr:NADH-quinone oxidoreductase subunit L [Buchnera aphidicola]USS94245.1 NADH-quinone oxidoreductase subunit L [Buchnera aphidicola (Sipha maydis)]